MGLRHDVIHRFTVDPTVNDDSTVLEGSSQKYKIGDDWLNTVTEELFECLDLTAGAAIWVNRTKALQGLYNVIAGPIELTADAILVAPSISTTQDDYNPNDGSKDFNTGGVVNVAVVVLDATSNVVITGMPAPSPAKTMRVLLFNNSATSNITLNNNDAGSVAANRFLSNGNVTINEKEAVEIFYSVSEARWIPVTR